MELDSKLFKIFVLFSNAKSQLAHLTDRRSTATMGQVTCGLSQESKLLFSHLGIFEQFQQETASAIGLILGLQSPAIVPGPAQNPAVVGID